jgi:allantoinase
MKGHGRYDYSPIRGRARYQWPNGAGLAVYVAVNLEHFSFGEGLGAELAPGGPPPDVLNYAWRDYGNRIGAWRLLDLFDELALPASVPINSAIYEGAPGLAEAFRARGDEFVGHGVTNSERQGVHDEASEAALIAEATATIARHEGAPPKGWLGPWISQSGATPDLLAEAGYDYLLDWCMDDQPIFMRARTGRILALPYPQEINDIPMIVGRKIEGPAFAQVIVDHFDEMLAQSAREALVMGIALHPYIVGQPHRLRHLRGALAHVAAHRDRIWLTRAGDIAAFVRTLPADVVPGV